MIDVGDEVVCIRTPILGPQGLRERPPVLPQKGETYRVVGIRASRLFPNIVMVKLAEIPRWGFNIKLFRKILRKKGMETLKQLLDVPAGEPVKELEHV